MRCHGFDPRPRWWTSVAANTIVLISLSATGCRSSDVSGVWISNVTIHGTDIHCLVVDEFSRDRKTYSLQTICPIKGDEAYGIEMEEGMGSYFTDGEVALRPESTSCPQRAGHSTAGLVKYRFEGDRLVALQRGDEVVLKRGAFTPDKKVQWGCLDGDHFVTGAITRL